MSLVSSLSIAQQALTVNQAAITVISNNIANVDNENYSKMSVNLSDVLSYTKLTGNCIQQANTLSGVQMADIKRYSNEFLESYYRTENSQYSYLKEYATNASSVEDLMNELNTTGLTTALSDFYDAASALADDPTDITLRQNYLSAADKVCSVFNKTYEGLNTIQESLVGDYTDVGSCDNAQIGTEVDEVNSILDQLAEVNTNIIKTNSTGSSANSLLDKRDQLLSELSQYIPVNVDIESNGTAKVSLGNYKLVAGSVVKGYLDVTSGTSADQPAVINIVADPKSVAANNVLYENVNSAINSGTIGAVLDMCGSSSSVNFTISGVVEDLDSLASQFAQTLNSIQSGAITDAAGNTTYAMRLSADYQSLVYSDASNVLFVSNDPFSATITASNISINSNLSTNLNLIAVGRSTSTTTSANVGDNSNVALITNSRTSKYASLNNQTFEEYLATKTAGIGTEVKNIESDLNTESTVLKSVKSQLASETGVNLDEELGDLIKFQQAYEAAARVFSTCNQLLSELIDLGR